MWIYVNKLFIIYRRMQRRIQHGSKIHGEEWWTKHSVKTTSWCFVNDLLREFNCLFRSVSGMAHPLEKRTCWCIASISEKLIEMQGWVQKDGKLLWRRSLIKHYDVLLLNYLSTIIHKNKQKKPVSIFNVVGSVQLWCDSFGWLAMAFLSTFNIKRGEGVNYKFF